PAKLERLADLVHEVHRVRGASRRDVARLGMAGSQHSGHVLLPAGVHEALLRARWRERRHRTVRRLARELDVGVRVRLVVVEQDEAVVVLVCERRRDGPEALTMCRMTSADSHPWQVRCPETKSSSYGTSLMPLIGGSAVVSTAITSSLRRSSDRCHRT